SRSLAIVNRLTAAQASDLRMKEFVTNDVAEQATVENSPSLAAVAAQNVQALQQIPSRALPVQTAVWLRDKGRAVLSDEDRAAGAACGAARASALRYRLAARES
ncbi:unnamed protein product, partial [Symbiodinium necroappetens]